MMPRAYLMTSGFAQVLVARRDDFNSGLCFPGLFFLRDSQRTGQITA